MSGKKIVPCVFFRADKYADSSSSPSICQLQRHDERMLLIYCIISFLSERERDFASLNLSGDT